MTPESQQRLQQLQHTRTYGLLSEGEYEELRALEELADPPVYTPAVVPHCPACGRAFWFRRLRRWVFGRQPMVMLN